MKISNWFIENNGGTVLDLSTDKIICNFPETNTLPFELDGDNNLKGYYFDDKHTIYKYKPEHKDDRIKDSRMQNFRQRDKHTYTEQNYNLCKYVKDNNFSPLVTTILEKIKVFIF